MQSRARVIQQKTQRPVRFEITDQARQPLEQWFTKAGLLPTAHLFPSRIKGSPHLSTRQYARIVGRCVSAIGLDPATYGAHSLRRTKASLIYRRTKNLRAVQILLGHTKLESTIRPQMRKGGCIMITTVMYSMMLMHMRDTGIMECMMPLPPVLMRKILGTAIQDLLVSAARRQPVGRSG